MTSVTEKAEICARVLFPVRKTAGVIILSRPLLALYPFLDDLSAGSKKLLRQTARPLHPRCGDCLLRQGDAIRGLYLVVAGKMRIFTLNADGQEASLYTLGPGETCPLALQSLLAECRHQAWVAADSPTVELLFLPAPTFRRLYDAEPAMREFTVRMLSGHITELMNALGNVSVLPIEARLWDYLTKHADQNGRLLTTHEQIARALGSAREVISRHLGRLRRGHQIDTSRGCIRLLQPTLNPQRIQPLAQK